MLVLLLIIRHEALSSWCHGRAEAFRFGYRSGCAGKVFVVQVDALEGFGLGCLGDRMERFGTILPYHFECPVVLDVAYRAALSISVSDSRVDVDDHVCATGSRRGREGEVNTDYHGD